MDYRKVYEALGATAMTFLTAIAIFQGFSEITADKLYQPIVQSLIVGVGVYLGRAIPVTKV